MCQAIKALSLPAMLKKLHFFSQTFPPKLKQKRERERKSGNRNFCNMKSSVRRRKKATGSSKPARKTRTKTRKPKYLSLKLELSPQIKKTQKTQQQKPNKMPQKQQLNLFPLHPENLVQDNKDMHDDHVAFLFETATDSSTTTLTSLLDNTTTTEEGLLSPAPTYVCNIGRESEDQNMCGGPNSLLKTAMRRKERDASEDRWVSYWEVVEKKEQEEVSSTCYGVVDALEKMMQMQGHDNKKGGLVGLKLDYQEILNAWSDKGPLYIQGESPQTVPDLQYDASNAVMEGMGNLWTVPEMGSMKMKEKEQGCWKSGQREASVLRYKEKRQSRLFSKRIRYEVRKLNAEKRPRLKGRFVKSNGEV